jgi:hypothetical protein
MKNNNALGLTFEDLPQYFSLEVKLNTPDDFLKVRETLTRIGIASEKNNTLYQSCHILHKQGRYYLCHFKELFSLDGKMTNFDDKDMQRRNTIAKLLADWGLVTLLDPETVLNDLAPIRLIKIIAHKDKSNWTLVTKYTIGKKGRYSSEGE